MKRTIPDDLAQFLRKCIDRLGTLEILLLLQSSRHPWTVPELTSELRSSTLAVEISLASLCAHGLVAKQDAAYGFTAASSDVAALIERLGACFRERRAAVTAAIYSPSQEAVHGFSDAFRFKKDGRDG